MTDDDRPCRASGCAVDGEHRHCPGPHRRAGHPVGLPVWCAGHTLAVSQALGQLPELAALLPVEYATRTNNPNERLGKTGKAASAPSASADVDALDELAQWFHEWTQVAIGHLRRHGPWIDNVAGLPHLDASITEGSRWLMAQWPTIAEDPDFPDEFGLEALDLAERLGRRLRLDDPVDELGVPCDFCGRARLRQTNGSDQVECMGCGRRWGKDRYELIFMATRRAMADGVLDSRGQGVQRLRRSPMSGSSRVGDPDFLVTTAQAAAFCRVEPASIRSWVARGYLQSHGRGRFRLGDVDAAERAVNAQREQQAGR